MKLFLQTVTQADQGADFDFLRAAKMRRAGAALTPLQGRESLP